MRSLLSAIAWTLLALMVDVGAASAQQPGRVYRIGWLWIGEPGLVPAPYERWTGLGRCLSGRPTGQRLRRGQEPRRRRTQRPRRCVPASGFGGGSRRHSTRCACDPRDGADGCGHAGDQDHTYRLSRRRQSRRKGDRQEPRQSRRQRDRPGGQPRQSENVAIAARRRAITPACGVCRLCAKHLRTRQDARVSRKPGWQFSAARAPKPVSSWSICSWIASTSWNPRSQRWPMAGRQRFSWLPT